MTKAILLDIEGTTTPIDFVHKTLFPFAKQRIAKYVEMNFDALRDEIGQLVNEHANDAPSTLPLDPSEPGSISTYLEHLIDVDRKSTPLKSIQGKIWQDGYESGELLSVVFDDVPKAFETWKAKNRTIAIYSSGSVLAQKLIFKYSNHGDLTPFISHYFDTNIGPKRSADSYRKIAREMTVDAGSILFVSDIVAELDAAALAGFQTTLSIRDGNAESPPNHSHLAITNFGDLMLAEPGKI